MSRAIGHCSHQEAVHGEQSERPRPSSCLDSEEWAQTHAAQPAYHSCLACPRGVCAACAAVC
eukprot:4368154-Pleurochrysis_carterae.AAC.1